MITQFSPFTRKLVAIALLFFAIFGAVNFIILPLASSFGSALDGLANSRFNYARLKAIESRPGMPPLAPLSSALHIHAANEAQAIEKLRGLIANHASQAQIRLISAEPVKQGGDRAQTIALRVALNGPAELLPTMIYAVEQGQPLVRFQTLRLWRDTSNSAETPVGARAPSFDPGAGAAGSVPPPTSITGVATSMQLPAAPDSSKNLYFEATVLAVWERSQ